MKKATVIIPNYNGIKFLEPCMAALAAQTCRDFSVLVVDNASEDGSVEWLEKNCPEAGIIQMETNTGFSGAVNAGIRASETPYVILLNNDTEVFPDYVGELIRFADRFPKVFSVSSKMIQLHHRDRIDDAGDSYNILGWAFQRGIDHTVSAYGKPDRIFSACAGAALYRREVFEKIGYFDENHFAYLEDIDVGYRAQIYGYQNWYCPTAKVYHVGSGTSGSKYNSFKVRLAARNSVYLNYKNMPAGQLVLNALPLALGYFLKSRFFKKNGFSEDYKNGLREGWKTRKNCRKVPFASGNLGHYCYIEWQLVKNMFTYTGQYLKRKL